MTIKQMNISNEAHDTFVKTHPNGDLLQLTTWANSKSLTGWYFRRIAVGDGETVKGVALLQFKRVPKLPFTLCYISRGFVCDYADKAVVEKLTELAVATAKREKAYAIKIDPDVEVQNAGTMLKDLEALGFVHKGFEDGLSKNYIQPRMTMITDIDKSDEDLIASFEKNNRSRVKLSLKKGTEAIVAKREDLKIFAQLMKETGERDGFLTRDVSYFETIYDSLNPNDDAELFLVKLVPSHVIPKLQEELKNLNAQKEKLLPKQDQKKAQNQLKDIGIKVSKLEKQVEELEQLNETHPEGKYLSGALLTFSGHKSYYLYGASSNEYRDYLPNHNMQITMMKFARDKGAKSYDFGGTSNNPSKDSEHYGLWQFKKMWGTHLSEKIGEFDYVLNKPMYKLIEEVKPRITKMKLKMTKGRK